MVKESLRNLILGQKAVIGVIGLGYVGLPLIIEFALKGFPTIGFEVDEKKVGTLNDGISHIVDVPTENVQKAIADGKFSATTDFSQLGKCDVIIICVPTPLRKTKDPDMSYILAAGDEIKKYARRGQLVILESTTYPGTTDEVLQPMIEEAGLKLNEDFLLAFSPERVDPGNPQFQTHNITKVVGGVGEDSTEISSLLYAQIVENVHPVSSARVAEAAKLWENTFRAINIGMANEMAKVCAALNIDSWEVVRAAATKPFGFMPFYPGPGIGGHCLSNRETVVVRDGEGKKVTNISELFEAQSRDARVRSFDAHGSDVIYKPKLEALSINMTTNEVEWKPVHYLFRRKTDADLVKVTTSDNRSITVTDQHPMLAVDEYGKLREVFAKDLKPKDRLPIHKEFGRIAKPLVEVVNNVLAATVKTVELIKTSRPFEVFSLEVDDNHTFATSYGLFVHNCIPLDPHYLSWKARQHGFDSQFITLAEQINSGMPKYVAALVRDALNDEQKSVKGSKILILGVAYKKDIDDMRESPALSVIDLLRARGANVVYHDDFVAEVTFDHSYTIGDGEPLYNQPLTDELLASADCVVICTEHSNVDYKRVCDVSKVIVDTRNALKEDLRAGSKAKIVRL
jgi:UDP-N-acetyl-D-mannosaminuronate dehydrogenase